MGWSGDNLADNQYQYDTINRYIGENSLDGQADFVLYHAVVDNVFTQGARNYQHLDYWTARSQDQYVEGAIMTPDIGSHDTPRIISFAYCPILAVPQPNFLAPPTISKVSL